MCISICSSVSKKMPRLIGGSEDRGSSDISMATPRRTTEAIRPASPNERRSLCYSQAHVSLKIRVILMYVCICNIYQYLSYMYIVYIHNRPIRPMIKKKLKQILGIVIVFPEKNGNFRVMIPPESQVKPQKSHGGWSGLSHRHGAIMMAVNHLVMKFCH